MTNDEIKVLEAVAADNDGHCDRCGRTIKIYRYRLNPSHAAFLRAMAVAIQGQGGDPGSGVNDIDISSLSLGYSVRTQVTKMRLHGLIARVKTPEGSQIPNRWLVTKKGWDFLNGQPIAVKVVVYDNQVLGHEGAMATIQEITGEKAPERQYEETAVSPAESRTYHDVRKSRPKMQIRALFRGHRNDSLRPGESYDLKVDRLKIGDPIKANVVSQSGRFPLGYKDIAAFQKDWRVL